MLIHGLLIVATSDNSYHVYDANRVLGGIVRFWIPQENGTMVRKFRAFGEDFGNLPSAVAAFTEIRGVAQREV